MVVAFLQQLTNQASVFAIDFLQTSRGLSATAANFMLVGAGLPGIPLMVIAGAASDRHGRRLVGCSAGLLSVAGALAFFWLPLGTAVLLPAMSLVLIGQLAAWPVLGTFATELFPTSVRSQAGAWANGASLAGGAASLALGAVLLSLTGSLPPTVTLLSIGPLVAIAIVALVFPDTHGRELEELNAGAGAQRRRTS
jgi:putative MFS transporter